MQFSTALLSAVTLGALAVNGAAVKRDSHSAKATWFTQNGNAGSCGNYNSDSSHVVALPSYMGQSHCGKMISIQHGGKTTQAKVQDTCPTCSGDNIDLSKGAFDSLASASEGEIPITWWFN